MTRVIDGLFLLALLCLGGSLQARILSPQDGGRDRTPPHEIAPGQACVECHDDVTRGARVHRPVAEQRCDACHRQISPPRHVFADVEGSSCIACHELPKRAGVHAPVEQGQCMTCHLGHHSPSRNLLKTSSEAELCGQCHVQETGEGASFVHGPVAAGVCTVCHSPHSSWQPDLLLKEPAQGCLECHTEMAERLQGPGFVHQPVAENCTNCHDAHASERRFQLTADTQTRCLQCHAELKSHIDASSFSHQAVTSGDGCLNCHRTHGSHLPKLLRETPDKLCLNCHTEPIRREDGTVLGGMGEKLAQSQFLHGPVAEGNCSACHEPHGSGTFSLLVEPYPQRFYAPFATETYGLCFRCHSAEAFTTPLTDSLTSFRDGKQNLHYVHVNRERKGRTCRACHDTHASNQPKHMTESVPFGSWKIPINFVQQPGGGSCSPGCHVQQTYRYESGPWKDPAGGDSR